MIPEGFSVALSSVMSQRLILNVRSRLCTTDYLDRYASLGEVVGPSIGSPKLPLLHKNRRQARVSLNGSSFVATHCPQASGSSHNSSHSFSETQWLTGTEDILTGIMMENLRNEMNDTIQRPTFTV